MYLEAEDLQQVQEAEPTQEVHPLIMEVGEDLMALLLPVVREEAEEQSSIMLEEARVELGAAAVELRHLQEHQE